MCAQMGEDKSPLGRYIFKWMWEQLLRSVERPCAAGEGLECTQYPYPGQSKIETAVSVMSNEVKKPDKMVHSNYGMILKP